MGDGWSFATGPAEADGWSQVVAVHALAGRSAADARALVATLRDLVAPSVLLLVDTVHDPLTDADLRALAFRRLATSGDCALYGFDLYDYKDRPDWLDARFWAHPELWDRFRW